MTTFIEDIQSLSREANEEVELAQAHTEAFVLGLDKGREVGAESFWDVPLVDDPAYAKKLAVAADNVVIALQGSGFHKFDDPREYVAHGRGIKIGLFTSFDNREGVSV